MAERWSLFLTQAPHKVLYEVFHDLIYGKGLFYCKYNSIGSGPSDDESKSEESAMTSDPKVVKVEELALPTCNIANAMVCLH